MWVVCRCPKSNGLFLSGKAHNSAKSMDVSLSAGIVLPPRKYRPKWWLRIFALFFFGFSATGLVHFLSAFLIAGQSPSTIEILAPSVLSLVGLGMVVQFFNTFVVVFPDAIELETFFSRKRLTVAEIRGKREYETTDSDGVKTRYIKLEPLDRDKPAIEFSRYFNFDSAFEEWIGRLPDLGR